MIQVFENRFDTGYLELLSQKLDVKSLKRSAIQITRDDKVKYFTDPDTNEVIKLDKAVKIDFCGFAATTLLGTNMEEMKKDIEIVYPRKAGRIIQLKTDISRKFKALLDPATVLGFNRNGMYLQIRFCFPYLYADFCISLMRAENSVIWNAKIDHEVSFKGNAPISPEEWEDSNLYRSQQASLKQIALLCMGNKSFSRVKDYDKATNTMETRFAVIPIPVCVLIINDVAITDSYMYAKVTDDHLAFNTPVNVVKRFRNKKDSERGKEDTCFMMLRQNFLYTFRHDLTMHADMASMFRETKPLGLMTVLPPEVANTQWQKKIDRIILRKKSTNKNYNPRAAEEVRDLKTWKENVVAKMNLCTRKIQAKKMQFDVSEMTLKIGREASKYCAEVRYKDELLFKLEQSNTLFCALAHYAYAKSANQEKKVQMHREYKSKAELRRAIIREMAAKSRIKTKAVKASELFKILFDAPPAWPWALRIPAKNITIRASEVHKAAYKSKEGKKISCLEGLTILPENGMPLFY